MSSVPRAFSRCGVMPASAVAALVAAARDPAVSATGWTTLSLRLLGNWRVGDEFRVTEHRQRRRQMQLFGSAHAYLIGEAFQGFDRDRRRRYLVDQDLLGLVCRELPDTVIAADQTGQRTGLHQLFCRGERGKSDLHGGRYDHVLRQGAEKGVRRQIQPLCFGILELAQQLGGAAGSDVAVRIQAKRPRDRVKADGAPQLAN